MSSAPQPPRKRRWPKCLLAFLLVAGVGGLVYLFRDELRDEWALRQYRRAAADGAPSLPERRDELLKRLHRKSEAENLDLAVRLAEDPDPKVRAASVDVLLADQPRAKRQDAVAGPTAFVRFSSWRTRVREAVEKLLKDPDETVRKAALQAVSELESADVFSTQLTEAMTTGTTAERVIVAEGLGRWNGSLLREVIGDPNQPDAVRIAAMRGLDTSGDHAVAGFSRELTESLVAALKSNNPDVARAAVVALRHGVGSAIIWLGVLEDDRQKTLHALALTTWIDALGNAPAHGWHWSDTHQLWFTNTSSARRCAVATHVLCEGAKLHLRQLETNPAIRETDALRDRQGPTGRAFDLQLTRLGNVLSVLSAVRWYCDTIKNPPALAEWLPHETPNAAPPKRELKAFLFQEAKPIWEGCLSRPAGYPTRFLGPNLIVRSYGNKTTPRGEPVQPLGVLMDELLLGQDAFDRLRKQYEGK